MNRTIIKIAADNKWKNLQTKSFKKLFISHRNETVARVIYLAGLPKRFANTTTAAPNVAEDGILFLQNVSIPPGATLCLEDISVANISSTIGNVNTDDFELMVRCTSPTNAAPRIDMLLES